MKYALLIIQLFIICPNCDATSIINKQIKVLFIGNSLTAYNNMPQTVQNMADEQKLDIKIDQLVFPKFCLYNFATQIVNTNEMRRAVANETSTGVMKILSEKWNFVILQEIGGYPLISEFSNLSFEPSLTYLDSIIKSIKGKTVLF